MTLLADSPAGLPAAVDPTALSLNENPYPPLPAVRSALIAALDAANRYPEFLPEQLRRVIAARIGVPATQVILGAGATGVILQVLHALTSPGDRIVMAEPTFDGYPIIAAMNRLQTMSIPLTRDGHHDLAAMAEAARDARVLVICRPHNPTGTVESAAAIETLLARLPDTLVVLDEAYVEFVAAAHRIDSTTLVQRFANVVVLRTFSKAYGLAGLRIGYGFGSRELADSLWAMQLPFGMSVTSLVAVEASYLAESQLRQRIQAITTEREFLRARLADLHVESIPGHANFLYLPPGDGARRLCDQDGLRVKHYGDGAVRLSIGAQSSTDAVLAALGSG
ncbi:MAG: aminotransferase class I/II-fold pyridoxal phosphate-dependent enzyme [Mycobacterium sp.]